MLCMLSFCAETLLGTIIDKYMTHLLSLLHSQCLINTHTHSLSLSLSHHSQCLTHSFSLTMSLSHTHSLSTHSLSHFSHSLSVCLSVSLSLSHTHFSHSHTLSRVQRRTEFQIIIIFETFDFQSIVISLLVYLTILFVNVFGSTLGNPNPKTTFRSFYSLIKSTWTMSQSYWLSTDLLRRWELVPSERSNVSKPAVEYHQSFVMYHIGNCCSCASHRNRLEGRSEDSQ
jgi:hypothetical protein